MTRNQMMDALNKIEAVASSLDIRPGWIATDIAELLVQPDWPTQAEDRLAVVEARLRKTLSAIEQHHKDFNSKPVFKEVA